jgi:hypothetical protein
MTVYLPDDLHERVKAAGDLNVSAICQAALESELVHRQTLAKLDVGLERIVVETDELGDAAFTGTHLHSEDLGGDGDLAIYLTKRHRIAVHAAMRSGVGLETFDGFEAFAHAYRDRPAMVSSVAGALGQEHVTELDI